MPPYSAHFWFFRIEQSRVRYMGIQYLTFCHIFWISRTVYGEDDLENLGIFLILGRDSPYPNFVSTVCALGLVQALLFRCVTYLEHTLYDTFPPQHGHTVTSFLYSILIACTLSSFRNRLRNSRQPIRFLQMGISFRLLWLLRSP